MKKLSIVFALALLVGSAMYASADSLVLVGFDNCNNPVWAPGCPPLGWTLVANDQVGNQYFAPLPSSPPVGQVVIEAPQPTVFDVLRVVAHIVGGHHHRR